MHGLPILSNVNLCHAEEPLFGYEASHIYTSRLSPALHPQRGARVASLRVTHLLL